MPDMISVKQATSGDVSRMTRLICLPRIDDGEAHSRFQFRTIIVPISAYGMTE